MRKVEPINRFQPHFPSYTSAERRVDGGVHVVGVTAGAAAILWLLTNLRPDASVKQVMSVAIYCCGLMGMLAASAWYNLTKPGRMKAILRRLDHSMIYVMIAGTYTPFSLLAFRPALGIPLCASEWFLALSGVSLTLLFPHRHERVSLILYLVMGWLVIPVLWPLAATLPASGFCLLVAGGLVYSLGSFIQTRIGWPFHNPVWHVLVCVAAGLHLAAVAQLTFAEASVAG